MNKKFNNFLKITVKGSGSRPLGLAIGHLVTILASAMVAAMVSLMVPLWGVAGWGIASAVAQPLETLPSTWSGRLIGEATPSEVRFLTDTDFPPFNYYDEDGVLTGFNVDMARTICSALNLVCTIKPATWDELVPALEAGDADAVIASHAISAANRRKVQFTDPYFRTPARFVVRSDVGLEEMTPEVLAGQRIGVVKGTAHEAFLRDFFADAVIVTFETDADARSALRFGKIDTLFGDGLSLMYWLNGASSRRCCQFRGGAYTESRYFGEGVGIAVNKGRDELAAILSQGIALTRANGDYEELLLRYFPMSLY